MSREAIDKADPMLQIMGKKDVRVHQNNICSRCCSGTLVTQALYNQMQPLLIHAVQPKQFLKLLAEERYSRQISQMRMLKMTKCHPLLGTDPTVSDQRLKFTKSQMDK